MPLDYSSVRNQYNSLYKVGATNKTMPEWAAEMNNKTQSDLYSAGLHDGWWTRTSHFLDENIFNPVASVTTEPIGRVVGGIFGAPEAGARVGRGLPRALVQTLPLYLAGPEAGLPATAAALGATGTLMGAQTYADTGNPTAGVISGIGGAALPLVGRFGGSAAVKALGLGERVGDVFLPRTAAEIPAFKAASFAGSQTAMAVTNEATNYGVAKVTGTPFDPLSADFLLSQIPFTVHDAIRLGGLKIPTAEQAKAALPPPVVKSEFVSPKSTVEEQTNVETLMRNLEVLSNVNGIAPEEHQKILQAVIDSTNDPAAQAKLKQAYQPLQDKVLNPPLPEQEKPAVNPTEPVVKPISTETQKAIYELPTVSAIDQAKALVGETELMKRAQTELASLNEQLANKPFGTGMDETDKQGYALEVSARNVLVEKATADAAAARESITKVPLTAEEIPSLIGDPDKAKPVIDKLVEQGHTPTQAVEQVRLQEQTPKLDVAKETEKRLTLQQDVTALIPRLNALKEQFQSATSEAAKGPIANQIKSLETTIELKTKQIAAPGSEKLQSVNALGKPQAKYGPSIRDENGKNFATQALAEAYRETKPELSGYKVRNPGAGKGFFLAEPINKEVSLEGTDLDKVLPAAETMTTPVESRPSESVQDFSDTLNRASTTGISELHKLLDNGDDIQQSFKEIKMTKEVLKAKLAGANIKVDPEMQRAVRKVAQAVGEWNNLYRSFTLDSKIPFSEDIAKQVGAMTPDGAAHPDAMKNWLTWFSDHPQSGEMGQLVRALTGAIDTSDLEFHIPLSDGFDPHVGTAYQSGRGTNGRITISKLPGSEAEAMDSALSIAHEVVHHGLRNLANRTDPTALQLRATLKDIRQTLEDSRFIPKKVRDVVKIARRDGWYDEYTKQKVQGGPDPLYERFVKAAGQDNAEWIHVFYGLLNEDELASQAFSSQHMVEMLKQTKVRVNQPQTLLQKFAGFVNKVFGKGPDTENAMYQLLSKVDNYLTSPKITKQVVDIRPNLYAGEGFLYGLAPYDGATNVLAGIHKLPNSGDISELAFKKIGGVGKPLQDAEIEFYKSIVPEAFGEKGVNVPKLVEGLKEKGPVVEVRKLGEGVMPSRDIRQAQMEHELDTVLPNWRTLDLDGVDVEGLTIPERAKTLLLDLNEIRGSLPDSPHGDRVGEGAPRYSFLGPKPESDMPGYVEGLVRVPITKQKTAGGSEFQTSSNIRSQTKYTGPHFGSEDTNVLAFYRGYEETLPTGEKAFHVIEVQSDWGQKKRKTDTEGDLQVKEKSDGWYVTGWHPGDAGPYKTQAEARSIIDDANEQRTAGHPLLKVYESLALKAAIAHAKEIGATKVILSDGETAMMTEGHDRTVDDILPGPRDALASSDKVHAQKMADNETRVTGFIHDIYNEDPKANNGKGFWRVNSTGKRAEPSQSAGMRLHYDQTLPSEMAKITGERGVGMEMGVHKNAIQQEGWSIGTNAAGSPVFRDSTGAPKTQITGRSYDISKLSQDQALVDRQIQSHQVAVPYAYNGRDYLRDWLLSRGVRPEALASRIDTIENLAKSGDINTSIDSFLRESAAGTLPATAEQPVTPQTFDAVRQSFATDKPSNVRDAVLGLLAADVPAHQELWTRMRQDITAARELNDNIKKGNVIGYSDPATPDNLAKASVRLNSMYRGLQRQAKDITYIKNLDNFTYDGFSDTQIGRLFGQRLPAPPGPPPNGDIAAALLGLAEIRRNVAKDTLEGTNQMGVIERALSLTQFMKKQYPAIRPALDNVRLGFARAIERINTLNQLKYGYNVETHTLDPEISKTLAKVASNDTLTQAASDIFRYGNVVEQSGKKWSWDDPKVQGILKRSGDPAAIQLEVNSEKNRVFAWGHKVLPESLTYVNTQNTARIIVARETGMQPSVGRDFAQQIYDGLAAMQDPAQAASGQEMLAQVKDKMNAGTFLAALRFAQSQIVAANKALQLIQSRTTFVGEQRFKGNHLVMRGPNNEPFRHSSDDMNALQKLSAEKEAQGYTLLDLIQKSDASTPGSGVHKDFMDAVQELDVQAWNATQQALQGVDPEIVAKVLPLTQRAAPIRAAQEAFKPLPNVSRRFVEGREYINMLENANEFYNRANNWLRHREIESSTSLDKLAPEIAGNKVLHDYVDQHVQNALTPDNPTIRGLTQAVYFQRLAFSLGNSLLESVQNLGTGMQALISETGSIRDAFGLWKDAIGAITKNTGKTIKDYGDPDLNAAVKQAENYGLMQMTTWQDVHDPDVGNIIEVNQRMRNPAQKIIHQAYRGARSYSSFFQRYNDRIGFIAGFKLAQEQGRSFDDAFNFAWDVKERGTFTGGKPQRAVGLWSIKSKPVPQMLSALQTYTFGWFSQMANDAKLGWGKPPPGLTETQRIGSRKAFLYGLAAQATLGGVLGLPGVGQGLAVLKQATGIDLKGKLRSTLATIFDEDTQNGGWITNMALRGGIAGVTPIDPSNRASLSFPFIGVDPYKGFDISQLLGAPGSSVSDAIKGTLAMFNGDAAGIQKLLPSVLKAPIQLIQNDGDVRDQRGGLLQQLTPAERFMTAIGLPSSRIQSARDTSDAVKQLEASSNRDKEGVLDAAATTYRYQGPNPAKQILSEYLSTHPLEDGRSLISGVAGRVEAQTVPYDYRREVGSDVSLGGLGSRMPSSEVQRLQLRNKVQQDFGIYQHPSFDAMQQAVTLDRVLDSNPYMSRSQATALLPKTSLARRRNNDLLYPEPQ